MLRPFPFVLVSLTFCLPAAALADVLNVPDDHATIQAAINASKPGDEVIVADGTYTGEGNRDIDFLGKTITVSSANGAETCIIDCEMSGRGFHFQNGETLEAVLDGFTITNGVSHSGVGGGGIACTAGSSPSIMNCIITLNESASHGGGGIFCDNSNPEIRGCVISENTSNGGGGIICQGSSPVIEDCDIIGNSAPLGTGGGISLSADSRAVITGCLIASNEANGGGGIRCLASDAIVTDCTIQDNTTTGHGGGMSNEDSAPMVSNCTFVGNHADDGGGMHNDLSHPSVFGTVFQENVATGHGGGIQINTGDGGIVLVNCTFDSNTADDGDPGNDGGAINTNADHLTIVNCRFLDNYASGSGGAIRSVASTDRSITNSVFVGNSSLHQGGGMFVAKGVAQITHCTLVGNSTETGGGGIAIGQGTAFIDNCIFRGNSDTDGESSGSQINDWDQPNTIVVSYSNVMGGFEGTGNIDTDPMFVDADGGDYHLKLASPCLDAGDNEAIPADTTDMDGDGDIEEPIPFDLDGLERRVNSPGTQDTGNGISPIVDMGPYEFQVCEGDVNGDGSIDPLDSGFVLARFGCEYPADGENCLAADANGDGNVDPLDSGFVLARFGECP